MTAETFPYGLVRITAASPVVAVGDPVACAKHCLACIDAASDSDIVVLPELALGGYTCGDLFGHQALLKAVVEALALLQESTRGTSQLVIVGAPLVVNDSLMNAAIALGDGKILAAVPKQYLPTYHEFYEARHFLAGDEHSPSSLEIAGQWIPFGTDLLLRWGEARIGIEICEDLWVPVPPSSLAALGGANILINLSASNETIGKAPWRRDLVVSQSGRCIAAYAYSSAGPSESSTDLVFSGHCLIAENGRLLANSRRVGDGGPDQPIDAVRSATADIDLQRLEHDRRVTGTWHDGVRRLGRSYRMLDIEFAPRDRSSEAAQATIDGCPFIPQDLATLNDRCAEILSIQSMGLAKRVTRLSPQSPLVIGVSGGLDSTLALLVAVQTCDANGWPRSRILGLTMPGFGTTQHTLQSAMTLMTQLGIRSETIDIRQLSLDTFRALGHQPLGIQIDDAMTVESLQAALVAAPHGAGDLVLENVQARLRTYLLMSRGFVLGTGDMSEQALGWCTYNADHMSMYNVNTSIPKTLVRFLVRHAAATHFDAESRKLLLRIADTPISPELLPPDASGNIRQNTEDAIGSYELHDFFLFHFVRNGFDRDKILYLATRAKFSIQYDRALIESTLQTFVHRFFANQFKRSCVPDGPKVGTVSLSPRGDWRMPSDADPNAF
ncbi:MAG: NAD(+) synthase [Planctomycetaceae bacterium]